MTTIERLTIRVSFLPFPDEAATEEWSFTHEPHPGEPEAWEIDEHQIEADLHAAFVGSGGTNTLAFRRSVSWGGWGAEGLTVLDIAISVSASVVSNMLWATIVHLYRKYTGKEPNASRVSLPAHSAVDAQNGLDRTKSALSLERNERQAAMKPATKTKQRVGKARRR
jgi:hypothetical protein